MLFRESGLVTSQPLIDTQPWTQINAQTLTQIDTLTQTRSRCSIASCSECLHLINTCIPIDPRTRSQSQCLIDNQHQRSFDKRLQSQDTTRRTLRLCTCQGLICHEDITEIKSTRKSECSSTMHPSTCRDSICHRNMTKIQPTLHAERLLSGVLPDVGCEPQQGEFINNRAEWVIPTSYRRAATVPGTELTAVTLAGAWNSLRELETKWYDLRASSWDSAIASSRS
eukprot:3232829-Rhodomonas_salina.1